MTLTIELPDNLEAALKAHADARGVSEEGYVRTLLERDLTGATVVGPLETGYGSLAQYGPAPTADEIDANRAEMFRQFGDSF
jgi:plasmid stability protein